MGQPRHPMDGCCCRYLCRYAVGEAVTNTPGLGAAEQALNQLYTDGVIYQVPQLALGYAVAYPLGVVGIILAMILIRAIFRVKFNEETEQIERHRGSVWLTTKAMR